MAVEVGGVLGKGGEVIAQALAHPGGQVSVDGTPLVRRSKGSRDVS